MRYLATVQYKGTNYCGWQKQNQSKLQSIQNEIEGVLARILNKNVKIFASGRTDAGVHAQGQTFHFDVDKELDIFRFTHSLNELLPNDIVVTKIKKVSDDFHARFMAVSKTYLYRILNSKIYDPFNENLAYQLKTKLDVEKMKKAAKLFVGEHNFQNFTSKDDDEADFIRNIYSISINEIDDFINIEFKGNGFMRYMVRMIVGNLVQVGLGKIDEKTIEDNLVSNVRKPSSYKAPAEGLYLKEVLYK